MNLRDARGAALFKRLAGTADVVCENFRPGTMERWGLGWEVLRAVNPGLVMLRVSGYGQDGPYKDRPGFARIGHAVGGLSHLSGLPGEAPVTPGSTSLGDYLTGLYGAVGVLVALRHRDKTGQGQMIDAALYESVFRVLDEIAPAYGQVGKVRGPEGVGTVNVCPHGHFPTQDGKWVAIACTTDRMFERLCGAMERPDLWRAYPANAARLAARDTVDKLVAAWTGGRSSDAVMAACLAHEVPCGPLNDIADIFADEHFQARGMLQNMAVEAVGDVVVPAVIPKLSETPGRIHALGPSLGNANAAVYGGLLGLSEDEIQALKADGVI